MILFYENDNITISSAKSGFFGSQWFAGISFHTRFLSKSIIFTIHLDKKLTIFVQIHVFFIDLDKKIIPYTITKAYEQRLLERKSLFMEQTGVKRGVVITFVTPMGLSKGIRSSLVHSEITVKDLFAEVEE